MLQLADATQSPKNWCCMAKSDQPYVYTDRDGVGTVDPAIRAYGSPFVGQRCVRDGAWKHGKALVRFADGTVVVVRARLLRKING